MNIMMGSFYSNILFFLRWGRNPKENKIELNNYKDKRQTPLLHHQETTKTNPMESRCIIS